ncbi:unnamed protein product [Chrysoparadoxa australica]
MISSAPFFTFLTALELCHAFLPLTHIPCGPSPSRAPWGNREGYMVTPRLSMSTTLATSAEGRGLQDLLRSGEGSPPMKLALFGGKGGVGKTSTSAAAAVQCADSGLNTLVLSTDPAHSLGDALEQKLGGDPMPVPGLDNLYAMEVDTEAAIAELEEVLKSFDVDALASSLGISASTIEGLGLTEFSALLSNPPPGMDELVALAEVVELSQSEKYSFDRIIIDTAPTGHTLRLLEFPDFLDTFLAKVIQLRQRLEKLLGMFKFGQNEDVSGAADKAVEKLGAFRDKMLKLQALLKNQEVTQFCVVTIPTTLAIAETERLVQSLQDRRVAVHDVIVNQLVLPDAQESYLQRLRHGQDHCLEELERIQGLELSKVPYFDMEVAGVYPLRYLSDVAFGGDNADAWEALKSSSDQKFVIVGGKGGVGKTTTSSALAVHLADQGFDTVVVSTDPAHSLGDALETRLEGGSLVPIPGITGSGRLFALEVDTEGAIDEFRQVVDTFMKRAESESGGPTKQMMDQLNLGDFASVLDSAPPGTDELVALSKVLKLVRGNNEEGIKFDRIVIDTAPTGHTLRMLTYPEFLDDFFEKLIRVRNKFKGATAMLNMFSGGGGKAAESEDKSWEEDRDRLRDFQFNMMELEELFRDQEKSEFVGVTIPTMLAVEESKRLVEQLRKESVPINKMIVNKIISESSGADYLQRMSHQQEKGRARLKTLSQKHSVSLVEVPYFDAEVT